MKSKRSAPNAHAAQKTSAVEVSARAMNREAFIVAIIQDAGTTRKSLVVRTARVASRSAFGPSWFGLRPLLRTEANNLQSSYSIGPRSYSGANPRRINYAGCLTIQLMIRNLCRLPGFFLGRLICGNIPLII